MSVQLLMSWQEVGPMSSFAGDIAKFATGGSTGTVMSASVFAASLCCFAKAFTDFVDCSVTALKSASTGGASSGSASGLAGASPLSREPPPQLQHACVASIPF